MPRTTTLPSPQPLDIASAAKIKIQRQRIGFIVLALEIAQGFAALWRRQGSPGRQCDVVGDEADAAIAEQNHDTVGMEAARGERYSLGVPARGRRHARRPQNRK